MRIRASCVAGIFGAILAAPGLTLAQTDSVDDLLAPDTATDASNPAATPTPAMGVSADAPSPVADSPTKERRPRGSRVLEEIVVTAQKREEVLQDVPISMAVFSGEKLDALGIDNPMKLPEITPGLEWNNLVGFSIIFIRGSGTDIFLPEIDPSVTLYLDGVYTPFAHSLAQELGKIERVEILKGPQGTLFGRNSTAGAINIVTARPSHEFSMTNSLELGEFETGGSIRKIKSYLTGPVSEDVQFGLSAFQTDSDSYYHRPADSRRDDFRNDRSHGVQLKVNWDVTETLSAMLTAQTVRARGSTAQILSSLDVRPLFSLIVPEREPDWTADPDSEPFGRSKSDMVYGELRWDPDSFFDFKAIVSQQSVLTDFNVDFDADSAPLVGFRATNLGARYVTGELQFLSNEDSWHSDRLKWIFGYNYFRKRDAGWRQIELQIAETLTDPLIGGPTTTINELLEALGVDLAVPTGVSVWFDGLVKTDAHAVFAQGTYNVTDPFSVTLGLRYQTEEYSLTDANFGLMTGEVRGPTIFPWASPPAKTESNLVPKLTLDYRVGEQLFFATAQLGFKSGAFLTANLYTPPDYVKPEEVTSYEIGLRGELFDGTVRYNLAAFHNTTKNVQVAFIALLNGGAISYENADEAVVKGVDGDLIWQPLPQTLPGLVLNAGGAYLDGEYTDYENGAGFNALGIFTPNLNFTGNETVRTPKFSGNVGANYAFSVPQGEMELGVRYSYNDGFYFDAQNVSEQPSYTLLNATVSYLHEPSNLRITVFGANLENSAYFLSRFPVDFNTSGLMQPPRTYGIRLSHSF